jgi:hypothetical protein
VTDPTPQPLRAHDDPHESTQNEESCVRNIYVRRVGEALDADGAVVPATPQRASKPRRNARKDR